MQMLFQWDMSRQMAEKLELTFWKSAKAAEQTRTFANRLFEGAAHDATALDELITKHAVNWRLDRLAAICSLSSNFPPGLLLEQRAYTFTYDIVVICHE